MRKLILFIVAMGIFIFPSFVFAQSNISLAVLHVQLWPEYDQPSMLVLNDFQLSKTVSLPADVTFRIPKDANLIAVASYTPTGELVNAVYDIGGIKESWQYFTIKVDTDTAYHFEYYQPIIFSGVKRSFTYLWDGSYAVENFSIRVLEPLDVNYFTSQPELPNISTEDDLKYHDGNATQLGVGKEFSLELEYKKPTNTLVIESQGVQPSAPVDENTQGRVSLNKALPYVIAGLVIIALLGGFGYFLQSNRKPATKKRRRSSPQPDTASEGIYCPQCGARAKTGDRFCRTCGARLRHTEE